MLPIILSAVVLILLVFVIVVASRPSQFRVTRATPMAAPESVVFPQVNNLHNWEAWSPWAKLDLAAKQTYDGPPEGVGASYAWAGNNKVGAGSMTITGSQPNQLVQMRLDFLKPFKATNTVEFTFKPEGGQTVVTWIMTGTNNFLAKAFGLFVDCDKMCGDFFEKGLADMKAIAERQTVQV
jgi:hypothetical protein